MRNYQIYRPQHRLQTPGAQSVPGRELSRERQERWACFIRPSVSYICLPTSSSLPSRCARKPQASSPRSSVVTVPCERKAYAPLPFLFLPSGTHNICVVRTLHLLPCRLPILQPFELLSLHRISVVRLTARPCAPGGIPISTTACLIPESIPTTSGGYEEALLAYHRCAHIE